MKTIPKSGVEGRIKAFFSYICESESKDSFNLNKHMIVLFLKKAYCAPQAETVPLMLTELLCTSPEDGGIEDVEFEEWVIE